MSDAVIQRTIWTVLEYPDEHGTVYRTSFATRDEAVEHAQRGLVGTVKALPMPDGGAIYVAQWGRHLIGIAETEGAAYEGLWSFDCRSLIVRIRYELDPATLMISIVDITHLVDIEGLES